MKWVALGVIAVAVLIAGIPWSAEFLAVDDCLDHGHVFDYTKGQCDFMAKHLPYSPFWPRHESLGRASALIASVGVVLLVASGRKRAVA